MVVTNRNTSSITTMSSLVYQIETIFTENSDWESRKEKITHTLSNINLPSAEIDPYVFFHGNCPYTRNVIATDQENYNLLMLCWKTGGASKIHNHPCDGCFIRPLIGAITESIYEIDEETNSITPTDVRYYCENQVSYMSDSLGLLHKVGNASNEIEAITLHLYCRPFTSCKVWNQSGKGMYDRCEDVKICCFDRVAERSHVTNIIQPCQGDSISLGSSHHSLSLEKSALSNCSAVNSVKDLFALCQQAATNSSNSANDSSSPRLTQEIKHSISSGQLPSGPTIHPSVEASIDGPNEPLFPSYIRSL
jgi:predicted metal-dependent enzyme (double-stranded beta helix superfamily)